MTQIYLVGVIATSVFVIWALRAGAAIRPVGSTFATWRAAMMLAPLLWPLFLGFCVKQIVGGDEDDG